MGITNNLIESLLYEEEGVNLDLKLEQYKFIKASDDEKSELLKDILAFVNSWRRTDAYILIGIREVKGGRSEVVGIADLLDDAALQQFVNTKTNRPVTFSYTNYSFEGKKIAIIHITIQNRPIYLKKDFGKLKKETVYIRRGSSTGIASIDEISKMGIQSVPETGSPELEVFFADPKTRTKLNEKQNINSLVLETPEYSSIPDYSPKRREPYSFGLHSVNYSYYRELVKFTRIRRLVSPFYLVVYKSGTSAAQDVRLEIKIDKQEGDVIVKDAYDFPNVPKSEYNTFSLANHTISRTTPYEINAKEVGDTWVVEARVEKVQAKAVHWIDDPFYIGAKQSCDVPLDIFIFSDELSAPKYQQLNVKVACEHRKVDLEDIEELEMERFKSSPEFARLMARMKKRDEQ